MERVVHYFSRSCGVWVWAKAKSTDAGYDVCFEDPSSGQLMRRSGVSEDDIQNMQCAKFNEVEALSPRHSRRPSEAIQGRPLRYHDLQEGSEVEFRRSNGDFVHATITEMDSNFETCCLSYYALQESGRPIRSRSPFEKGREIATISDGFKALKSLIIPLGGLYL